MASGELYHWLEAIRNRREYAEDQLSSGTPALAISRPEGIVVFGVGLGQSKVFEIYDRHAMGALGHPVDIEKLRQLAIEAAHLEGFNRSPEDVTLRRLISFSISSGLKDQFEQILSPPLLVRSLFAEVGPTPAEDSLVTLNFDGVFDFSKDGLAIVAAKKETEDALRSWIHSKLKPTTGLKRTIHTLYSGWAAVADQTPLTNSLKVQAPSDEVLDGRQLEVALLDRHGAGRVKFRIPNLS